MPRKPIGETAMTDAERQARYRAARAAGKPVIRVHRALDHRGRARRWNDNVAGLVEGQVEYAAWLVACRKTCGTARSPRHYRRSAIWISPSFRRSYHHAASAGTDRHRLAACTGGSTGTPYGLPAQAAAPGSLLDADRGSLLRAD